MSSDSTQTQKCTQIQPVRSYQIPGGPTAANLGPIDVKILAEVTRGGAGDNVR